MWGLTGDGLGPGWTQALNVSLGPGLGFGSSQNAEPRAGLGRTDLPGLLGSALNHFTIKNINFMQTSGNLTFMNRAKILEIFNNKQTYQ